MPSSPAATEPHPSPRGRSGRRTGRPGIVAAGVGIGVLTLLTAACGSSSHSSNTATTVPATTVPPATAAPATTAPATAATGGASTKGSGSVSVLYAGSLMDLMQKAVGPGFKTATGVTENGYGHGSKDLAADIKGKIKQGDVFVSASPKVNATLEGTANGSWLSWYATFATSKLVLGYNPKSTFAAALKTKPWYDVITEKGFRIGLTDPASDPKGELAVKALDATAAAQKLPALTAIGTRTANQYQETGLEGEVEAGQLDAGFFYQAEADSAGIVTVPLTGTNLAADYTLTILKGAPNPTGAAAFVSYLLGPAGQAEMTKYGFIVMTPPKITGTGVPASLRSVLGS